MLIGITGKTGSGKNHVAEILKQWGWQCLDMDVLAHDALGALAERIEEELGLERLEDGTIDRRDLGRLVFNDPTSLSRLEGIIYPWIVARTVEWMEEKANQPTAIHAVNLHKTDLVERCGIVLWIWAPQRLRRRRVMDRDGLTWSELEGRFQVQKKLKPKLYSGRAEIYRIGNLGNDAALKASLDRILGPPQKVDLGGME